MRYDNRLSTLYSVSASDGRYVYLYSVPRNKGMASFQSIGCDAYMRTNTARMTRGMVAEDLILHRQDGARIVNVSRAMYQE